MKLGTLQRWVRECDAASKKDGEVVWEVLEAILRATEDNEVGASVISSSGDVVRRTDDWAVRDFTEVTSDLIGMCRSLNQHHHTFKLIDAI